EGARARRRHCVRPRRSGALRLGPPHAQARRARQGLQRGRSGPGHSRLLPGRRRVRGPPLRGPLVTLSPSEVDAADRRVAERGRGSAADRDGAPHRGPRAPARPRERAAARLARARLAGRRAPVRPGPPPISMTAPTTLYQWLRAEPGRRLPLASVHLDDARQAAREARSDGWRLWVEGGPDGYVEAICEIECARRQRERGARPP